MKKAIALLLALLTILTLTACAPATEVPEPTPSAAPAPTEAPEPSKAPESIVSFDFSDAAFDNSQENMPTQEVTVFEDHESYMEQIIKLFGGAEGNGYGGMEYNFNEEYFAEGNAVAMLRIDRNTSGNNMSVSEIYAKEEAISVSVRVISPDISSYFSETHLVFVGLDADIYNGQAVAYTTSSVSQSVWSSINSSYDITEEKIIYMTIDDYLSAPL